MINFDSAVKDLTPRPGYWNVGVVNTVTGKRCETQGDIPNAEYGWKNFFEWLLGDISEMDIGNVDDTAIEYIEFAGDITDDIISYRGYDIDCVMGNGYVTVFYGGDEVAFDSVDDARAFIDTLEDDDVIDLPVFGMPVEIDYNL